MIIGMPANNTSGECQFCGRPFERDTVFNQFDPEFVSSVGLLITIPGVTEPHTKLAIHYECDLFRQQEEWKNFPDGPIKRLYQKGLQEILYQRGK